MALVFDTYVQCSKDYALKDYKRLKKGHECMESKTFKLMKNQCKRINKDDKLPLISFRSEIKMFQEMKSIRTRKEEWKIWN